ncbi:MAG: hypothetical protein K2X50_09870 [Gammaproteobacteria bacterium]|nr:hypothetical protein [Gammaproteobacteria bacterium]
MVHRFKCLWGSLGIIVLSLYCRGVLAAQAVVNSGGAVVTSPQPQVAPVPAPVPAPTPAPHTFNAPANSIPLAVQHGQITQKEVMIGSMAAFGRLFTLIAFFWLLVNVMRKLGGGKPSLKKPLILGGVGIALAYIIPAMMK